MTCMPCNRPSTSSNWWCSKWWWLRTSKWWEWTLTMEVCRGTTSWPINIKANNPQVWVSKTSKVFMHRIHNLNTNNSNSSNISNSRHISNQECSSRCSKRTKQQHLDNLIMQIAIQEALHSISSVELRVQCQTLIIDYINILNSNILFY